MTGFEEYTEKHAISIKQAILVSTFVDIDFNAYNKSEIVMYFKDKIYQISFLRESWVYLNKANEGTGIPELLASLAIATKENAKNKINSINGAVKTHQLVGHFKNGRLHNENEPAIIDYDKKQFAYFIDGEFTPKEKFNAFKLEDRINLHNKYKSSKVKI